MEKAGIKKNCRQLNKLTDPEIIFLSYQLADIHVPLTIGRAILPSYSFSIISQFFFSFVCMWRRRENAGESWMMCPVKATQRGLAART